MDNFNYNSELGEPMGSLDGSVPQFPDLSESDAGESSRSLPIRQLEEQSEQPDKLFDDSNHRKPKLQKYTLYETRTRMYIVGSNARESMYRVLEIDLTVPKQKLSVIEDNVFYTRHEILQVLQGLKEEAEAEGGLKNRLTGWGLLGFIRFTECYYLSIITKRSTVAILGGHYIYHIDATELIPVACSSTYKKPARNSEEARFLSTFQNLDISKTFYFSYTYDLTNTLQTNITREKQKALGLVPKGTVFEHNEMFVWNNSLLGPVLEIYDRVYDWFQPIIHGFIDQSNISVYDRRVYITLIARRSHHFAGARYLKRGVNDQGNVANEVESEQIVSDMLTTSFHDPSTGYYNSSRYTSYVQHRGSIPLYWSQEVSNMTPKPPIEINIVDPYFSAAALHFDDMFRRYGTPLLVLNLIKAKEKTPRESKLLKEFDQCIKQLNTFLPKHHKILYTAWDMSRASKSRGQDVIEYLENYADKTLQTTGFFHNGYNLSGMSFQKGVCRTNCIDCLDRTNAAQFVIGKKALGYQLKSLGIIETIELEYDSDAVNLLTEMFHDHGDTIALQYGGSHLVNTMETYRKINQWSSHSRDMVESIRRFYSNSFVDQQRQEAINLFLGNYVWEKGQPMLWDLYTDYYLHNDFFARNKYKISYQHWWTNGNLHNGAQDFESLDIFEKQAGQLFKRKLEPFPGIGDNYWNEYYRPRLLTSLETNFEYNMNSTSRYIQPITSADDDLSQKSLVGPFISRKPKWNEKRKHHDRDKDKTNLSSEPLNYQDSDSASISPDRSSNISIAEEGNLHPLDGIRFPSAFKASPVVSTNNKSDWGSISTVNSSNSSSRGSSPSRYLQSKETIQWLLHSRTRSHSNTTEQKGRKNISLTTEKPPMESEFPMVSNEDYVSLTLKYNSENIENLVNKLTSLEVDSSDAEIYGKASKISNDPINSSDYQLYHSLTTPSWFKANNRKTRPNSKTLNSTSSTKTVRDSSSNDTLASFTIPDVYTPKVSVEDCNIYSKSYSVGVLDHLDIDGFMS